MMPLFKPLAGFSPSCCAVLVQIEHWANALLNEKIVRTKMKNNIAGSFFINDTKLIFLKLTGVKKTYKVLELYRFKNVYNKFLSF